MRAIDADTLIPKLKFIIEAENQIYGRASWGFATKCVTAVEDSPTIKPNNTGEWEQLESGSWWCKFCGANDVGFKNYNFCPNCGADMRGEN